MSRYDLASPRNQKKQQGHRFWLDALRSQGAIHDPCGRVDLPLANANVAGRWSGTVVSAARHDSIKKKRFAAATETADCTRIVTDAEENETRVTGRTISSKVS